MNEETKVAQELLTPLTIKDIQPLRDVRGTMINTRNEIKRYVELPLVDACEHFWDLNIQTLSSSANIENIGKNAYIVIDFNTLSEENKAIVQAIGKHDEGASMAMLDLPLAADATVEEVKTAFLEIAKKFKKQPATWLPSYTLQDMNKMYSGDENEPGGTVEYYVSQGYYYDSEGQKFYISEEHFRKVQEKVE